MACVNWQLVCWSRSMSKITEASRDHIADENFAFPKERKEPIHDGACLKRGDVSCEMIVAPEFCLLTSLGQPGHTASATMIFVESGSGLLFRRDHNMASARCETCGRPRGLKRNYVHAHDQTISLPGKAILCGAPSCARLALIWLTDAEEHQYLAGARVFRITSRGLDAQIS
jgi:hypothetical protein